VGLADGDDARFRRFPPAKLPVAFKHLSARVATRCNFIASAGVSSLVISWEKNFKIVFYN
jgi:hypothetical protein